MGEGTPFTQHSTIREAFLDNASFRITSYLLIRFSEASGYVLPGRECVFIPVMKNSLGQDGVARYPEKADLVTLGGRLVADL